MDTPNTPDTPDTPNTQNISGAPDGSPTGADRTRARRPWGRIAAVTAVAGAVIVGSAAVGAALVGGPREAALHGERFAPMRGHAATVVVRTDGPAGRSGRMGRMAPATRDGLDARRDARLDALANELGLDPDEVRATLADVRAELQAERSAARDALAEAHRERIVDALVGLGADAEAADTLLDELHADAGPGRGAGRHGPDGV